MPALTGVGRGHLAGKDLLPDLVAEATSLQEGEVGLSHRSVGGDSDPGSSSTDAAADSGGGELAAWACLIEPAYLITCWVIVLAPCTIGPGCEVGQRGSGDGRVIDPVVGPEGAVLGSDRGVHDRVGSSENFTSSRFSHSKRASSCVPVRS